MSLARSTILLFTFTCISPQVLADVETPPPGEIKTSEVSGNTAAYGRRAHFWVSISSQPSSDVTIGLRSTDPSEGELGVDELVFTPENWEYRQSVDVFGRNQTLQNVEQHYSIVLEPAQSADSRYHLLDAEDVRMRGAVLELSSPQEPIWVVAGLKSLVFLDVLSTVGSAVNYELLNAPAGMTIDRHGTIKWTPPMGSAGSSTMFSVRATLRARPIQNFESVLDLTVNVAPVETVNTEVVGNELRVVDASTSANDLRFQFLSDSPVGRELKRVDSQYLPPIPSIVTRLTDIVYSTDLTEGDIRLLVPLSVLPDESDWSRLAIYYRLNSTRVQGWSSGSPAREVINVEGVEYAVLKSYSVQGEHFIGLKPVYR